LNPKAFIFTFAMQHKARIKNLIFSFGFKLQFPGSFAEDSILLFLLYFLFILSQAFIIFWWIKQQILEQKCLFFVFCWYHFRIVVSEKPEILKDNKIYCFHLQISRLKKKRIKKNKRIQKSILFFCWFLQNTPWTFLHNVFEMILPFPLLLD